MTSERATPADGSRRAVVVAIVLAIALVHVLRVGARLPGAWRGRYYAFASDVMLPFGGYFLLCQAEAGLPFLRDWRVKAAVAFGVASFAETMQALGVPLLGRTFDPLDYAMYATGVLLAVVADRAVLPRRLPAGSAKAPARVERQD